MSIELRDFAADDADAVNRIALAAFRQYEEVYQDWEQVSQSIGRMVDLSKSGELIVAYLKGEVVGAVVYVAHDQPKPSFFLTEWPVIRMLVVEPKARGLGIGRALTKECVDRAIRDGAGLIALHTSPIMKEAMGIYLSMGFRYHCEAPPLSGVPCAVYVKLLWPEAHDESEANPLQLPANL